MLFDHTQYADNIQTKSNPSEPLSGARLAQAGTIAHDVFVGSHEHVELEGGDLGVVLARPLILLPHIVHTPALAPKVCLLFHCWSVESHIGAF